MLFRHKDEPQKKLQVDLGDLQEQKEHLKSSLETHLKVTVYVTKDKLAVDQEKGIYHRATFMPLKIQFTA